jgi:aerobic carbon-monoxide dehydrogenase large subunit
MSILGNRVLRKEDPKFLTVGGSYVYDLKEPLLEGAVHVTYVRSTVAHARLLSIDTSDAAAAPGVVAILTAESMGLTPAPTMPFAPQFTSTALASGKVRYVGEPIAAVITEEKYQGEDAAELVIVDYEPLHAVIDLDESLAGTTLLWEEVGTNLAMDSAALGMPATTDDSFFEGCEVVVKQRVMNQRVAPSPLETRSAAAAWTTDGRLIYWVSSQHVQGAKQVLDAVYGAEANVRVITPDVGGGFGAKIGIYPDEILLGGIAKALGRPVRWTETRSESMVALGHGRAQQQDIEIGGSRDGKVLAYRLVATQDCGAYPAVGMVLAPFMTRPMSSAVYAIPKIECQTRSVVTNTTPIVAYRGAGRPEATAAAERAMDLFAAEIGMDPVEVRRKNLIPAFSEPYTTAVGQSYDVGNYEGALDKVLAHADYAALRAEQQARRESGSAKQLGIGVSVYVEITGGAPQLHEFGHVVVNDDGSATVYTGTSPHGQGHATAWSMLVQEQTGIPFDKIDVVHGDTDLVPEGGGTMGSRSLQQGGSAVYEASALIVDKAKELAAKLLEAGVEDVVLDKGAGAFHVAGTPAISKSWGELAAAAKAEGDPLDIRHRFDAGSATFPFGAHLAVVEVDTETGQVRLIRHVAVDDAGKVLNPTLLEGQIHGGIAQGAAQALLEEVRYDEDGNPITSNLADYAFISMAELPSFEVIHMETPTFVNPLGAKGVGESGTIGSTPAVQSAVCDAVAHLGVKHIDMPATAERVWRAIHQ